eukprot:365660-Chlamydomonas_euryale.AAC.14
MAGVQRGAVQKCGTDADSLRSGSARRLAMRALPHAQPGRSPFKDTTRRLRPFLSCADRQDVAQLQALLLRHAGQVSKMVTLSRRLARAPVRVRGAGCLFCPPFCPLARSGACTASARAAAAANRAAAGVGAGGDVHAWLLAGLWRTSHVACRWHAPPLARRLSAVLETGFVPINACAHLPQLPGGGGQTCPVSAKLHHGSPSCGQFVTAAPSIRRAEVMRMLFNYGSIEFTDQQFSFEEWGKEWKAKMTEAAFGQVPVLEVDGKMLSQSGAMERYIAKKIGVYPTDDWEAAKVEEAAGLVQDMLITMFFCTTTNMVRSAWTSVHAGGEHSQGVDFATAAEVVLDFVAAWT